MFARFFAPFRRKKQAYNLYGKLVSQARLPVFYEQLGVEDSIDGRFDMILLHMFLLDRRLEKEGETGKDLRRMLQEAMISDMDRSLRELGVGDMSVGKEVKKMGAAWFGRLKAYTAAVAKDAPKQPLAAAIAKNVYRGAEPAAALPLAVYVLEALQKLGSFKLDDMLECRFDFPEVTSAKEEHDA